MKPQGFSKNSNLRSDSVICQKLELIKIETIIYEIKMSLGSIMTSLEGKGRQTLLS